MLNIEKSKIDPRNVKEFKLHSTIDELVEGQGMAGVWENGEIVAKPSSATQYELFLGFALTRLSYPTKEVVVEILAAVATTLTLSYTPVTPSTDMRVETLGGTAIAYAGSGPGDGQFTISGNVVTLHADESGATLKVTYKRALTIEEAERKYFKSGDLATREAGSVTRSVGIIQRGVVFTDQFIAADAWGAYNNNAQIISTASGLLTLASVNGGKVNGKPVAAPGVDSPWLGVQFDAVGQA